MSSTKLKPLKPIKDLTETEWLNELTLIDSEVIHVVDIFNFLEEINRLGLQSVVSNAFNTAPLFWNVQRDCLQESLFMGLGRLCDAANDVINIHRVLNTAILHPEFFSEQALRQRIKARKIPDQFIDNLVAHAWIPKEPGDWKYLKKSVNPHLNRIEQIYKPIRNAHYGHRLTQADIGAMFAKTNRKELSETLDALHELLTGLNDLYERGVKPEIGARDLELHNNQIKGYARSVIQKLAGKDLGDKSPQS